MPSNSPPTDRLIIFLKFPEAGRVKTRLAASVGPDRAATIYRLLAEHTLRQIAPSSSPSYEPWIFFDPPAQEDEVRQWLGGDEGAPLMSPQSAGDLGHRMSEAFHRTFAHPATGRAVIIGTDCPSMDRAVISTAFDALDRVPVVLGPSTDGGYYLLGLRQEMPWLFERIAWSTEHVLEQTVSALRARNIDYSLLPELPDIDTKEDLDRWLPGCDDRGGFELSDQDLVSRRDASTHGIPYVEPQAKE